MSDFNDPLGKPIPYEMAGLPEGTTTTWSTLESVSAPVVTNRQVALYCATQLICSKEIESFPEVPSKEAMLIADLDVIVRGVANRFLSWLEKGETGYEQ